MSDNNNDFKNFNIKDFLADPERLNATIERINTQIAGLAIIFLNIASELQRLDKFGTNAPVTIKVIPATGLALFDVLTDLIGVREQMRPIGKDEEIKPMILMVALVEALLLKTMTESKAKEDKADGPSESEVKDMLNKLERL